MKKTFFLLFVTSQLFAQQLMNKYYELTGVPLSAIQFSNSITDIKIQGDTVWLGTGKGLSRSTDAGRTWKNYYGTPEFGTEDISALAVKGKTVWVATAHSVDVNGSSLPEGSGLRYSSDGGESWKVIPQPVDINNIDTLHYGKNTVHALGITTTIQNITYDIAITDSAVWIASWAGMIRTTTDNGETWNRVVIPPDNRNSISINDSLTFDLSPSSGKLGLSENLNHSGFSLFAEDSRTIWIGTAGGINKTTDGGNSWNKFSHQNQVSPISGNFVVALSRQIFGTKNILWAATKNARDSTEQQGVSYSEDGGISWRTTLLGEFVHNFGFKDSIVYVPTDNGVFRSSDLGITWSQTGTIYDQSSRHRYTQSTFYAASSLGDTVWLGGNDGIVTAIDNSSHFFGSNWNILHASQPLSSSSSVYAYPNPFAPDDEVVRIHYSTGTKDAMVTVRIFDFGMNLVKTVVQNVLRNGTKEHDEIWDGTDSNNTIVSNNVYFYQVIVGNDESRWGKILVLR
jgi:hypothetical protein